MERENDVYILEYKDNRRKDKSEIAQLCLFKNHAINWNGAQIKQHYFQRKLIEA